MNQAQAAEYINEQFESACIDLFEGFQCNIEAANGDDMDADSALLTSIDAGSQEMEMKALLRMPFSVLALTYPGEEVTEIEEEQLEDWMAEIANLLIGKLKTRLMSHGVRIKIGLPENCFDGHLEDVIPDMSEEAVFYFSIDNVTIECRFYLELMTEEIDIEIDQKDDDVQEGELEFF